MQAPNAADAAAGSAARAADPKALPPTRSEEPWHACKLRSTAKDIRAGPRHRTQQRTRALPGHSDNRSLLMKTIM